MEKIKNKKYVEKSPTELLLENKLKEKKLKEAYFASCWKTAYLFEEIMRIKMYIRYLKESIKDKKAFDLQWEKTWGDDSGKNKNQALVKGLCEEVRLKESNKKDKR